LEEVFLRVGRGDVEVEQDDKYKEKLKVERRNSLINQSVTAKSPSQLVEATGGRFLTHF
jgi:hypothetical protein